MNELGPFSFWELLVLIVGGSAILGGVGVWYAHRLMGQRDRPGEDHNAVLIQHHTVAAVVYSVLLAFIVIAVWQQYSAVKGNVASEASTLATMYRETQGMPIGERTELRHLIRQYTDAVIGPEWTTQRTGGASPVARRSIVDMYAVVGRVPPRVGGTPINTQFVADLSAMTSDRTKRLLATRDALPWILWLGLIAGAVIVVATGWGLYMENVRLHAAISGVVAGLIGLLLFSTLVLGHPFSGSLGIKPHEFEHSVAVYNAVDQTPV